MKLSPNTFVLVVILFLAAFAGAQTTTTVNVLPNQGCVHIDNCISATDDGNKVWVSGMNFVDILYPYPTALTGCSTVTAYNYQLAITPAPSITNRFNDPFTLHVECSTDTVSIVVDETGYQFYYGGGGGRAGGGAGTRYHIDSGTVTTTQ